MRKLLIPLFFLLSFSTSVKSDFEKNFYQVGKASNLELGYFAEFFLEYDSFTGETKCAEYGWLILPRNLEFNISLDTEYKQFPKSLKRFYPSKRSLNKNSLFIWNRSEEKLGGKKTSYVKYRFDNGPIIEPPPNGIIEIPYSKWKQHNELKLRDVITIDGSEEFWYGKSRKIDHTIYLQELDRFSKDARKYGCILTGFNKK
mgnify:FL=1|tara:strand:- start:814 stop:1416 length:603 start_codon:yes stop_codon:yes gene_type:complete